MRYSRTINNIKLKKSIFKRLNKLFHTEPKNKNDLVKLIRNSEKNNLIDKNTKEMLEGIINISYERVRDIMTPKSKIIYIKKNYTLNQCIETITRSSHSKFPIINKNNIEGLITTKNLLKFIYKKQNTFNINKILKPVITVPESKKVNLLLKKFKLEKWHMAIAINEFSEISGLVTIKDILEPIIGKINNNYNKNNIYIRKLSKHIFSIKGITPINYFNKTFNTNFKKNIVDTIGGLLINTIGYMPTCGETIMINNYKFKITTANSRQIIQIQVKIPKKNKLYF